MNKIITFVILTLLSGCTLFQDRPPVKEVRIYTIPTMPKANIPAPIIAPDLQVPTPIITTAEETSYYAEACEAISSGDYTKDELSVAYPSLSRSNACDWAVTGFTIQGWFTLESQLVLAGTYTEQLRARISFLEGMIKDREEIANRQKAAINKIK